MINSHFLNLTPSYLFSDIARRVEAHVATHPDLPVIRLGIGDVTLPLPPVCIAAMHRAVDEMARPETFRGYGPEQGYAFLRQAILDHDFTARGVSLTIDEIFVSDGAKSDCGNIGDILSPDCTVAITDPVYPVYIDSNVMAGRHITLLPATAATGFVPEVPADDSHYDIIYLCYPNNPTGAVITRDVLAGWVDYAHRHHSIILYDAAYSAYIRHDDIPHTIYEIPGAERCAIEFHSFSKTAGFTGLRCGYTVVPRALTVPGPAGSPVSLNALWLRRQTTKFNGVSYVTQRAAEAIFSAEGQAQVRSMTDAYMANALYLRTELAALGYDVSGGTDAPYVWLRTPDGYTSWQFFDRLLHELSIVTTPGAGFGPGGEGFVRLTAFGRPDDYREAIRRLAKL